MNEKHGGTQTFWPFNLNWPNSQVLASDWVRTRCHQHVSNYILFSLFPLLLRVESFYYFIHCVRNLITLLKHIQTNHTPNYKYITQFTLQTFDFFLFSFLLTSYFDLFRSLHERLFRLLLTLLVNRRKEKNSSLSVWLHCTRNATFFLWWWRTVLKRVSSSSRKKNDPPISTPKWRRTNDQHEKKKNE